MSTRQKIEAHYLKVIIVRPDFYIFGVFDDIADLPSLVDEWLSYFAPDIGAVTAGRMKPDRVRGKTTRA